MPPTPKPCIQCGTPHTGIFTKCGACIERAGAGARAQLLERIKAEKIEQKRQAWFRVCPESYRATDWKNPALSPVCRDLARRWEPDWTSARCGLLIWGNTGLGKTRAAYGILRRLHWQGIPVKAVEAVQFARAVADRTSADRLERAEARSLLRQMREVRVLLLDDLGKERSTPAVAAELHDLLEDRMQRRQPVLLTTERTGAELAPLLGGREASANYADGIIRRLREMCQHEEAMPAGIAGR